MFSRKLLQLQSITLFHLAGTWPLPAIEFVKETPDMPRDSLSKKLMACTHATSNGIGSCFTPFRHLGVADCSVIRARTIGESRISLLKLIKIFKIFKLLASSFNQRWTWNWRLPLEKAENLPSRSKLSVTNVRFRAAMRNNGLKKAEPTLPDSLSTDNEAVYDTKKIKSMWIVNNFKYFRVTTKNTHQS